MRNKEQKLKIIIAVMLACLIALFCSCVKDLPDDGAPDLDGRETLFAPAVTTTPEETTETEVPAETTAPPINPETTAPQDETTAPESETTAPETTESVETENPVYTGGFSGLY